MSDGRFSHLPSLKRALALALLASLMPLSAAFAQENPRVRVARDEAAIRPFRRPGGDVITMTSSGAVLEVIHVAGDFYAYRETNWYLVILPPDTWGRRHVGWVSGRDVEELPPPQREERPAPARTSSDGLSSRPAPQPAAPPTPVVTPTPFTAARAPSPAPAPAPAPVDVPDVVVHFAFDKSDLTLEAKSQLDCAMEMAVDGRAMAFALEGHTDWSGPERYNEKLGFARAQAVKSYLIEQHRIPEGKISVTSRGESVPAASNDTREGRAMNRRVVVQVGR